MADTKDELQPQTSNASNITAEDGKTQKKKGGIINHYKRWWWVHLIVLIVCALVITLPIVYVAYPKIAQSDVNKSKLNITSMSILNPTADTLDLAITSKLTNKAMYHPEIYGFEGDLYLGDSAEPFSSIPVPSFKASNGAIVNINTSSTIKNETLFADYTTAVLKQENVTIHLRGKTKLKQGALPKTNINFQKTITMTGFNGLANLTITNLTILLTTQSDGANMAGLVTIPNPTVQTLSLGNLTLSLALPTSVTNLTSPLVIGSSTINNTLLHPHTTAENTFDMRATTNESLILELLKQDSSLVTKGLPVLVTGKSVVYDGVEVPWLTQALERNSVEVVLDVGAAVEAAGLGSLIGL